MDRLKYFKGMYPHAYDPPVCCKKKYFSTGFGEIFDGYCEKPAFIWHNNIYLCQKHWNKLIKKEKKRKEKR